MIPQNTLQKLPNVKSYVLPGKWLFNHKRQMDGYTLKFKARYCVRGDKKTEGVDYFEEYAPVISWSTVLLALTLIFPNGSHTKQVYCTNAFSQSYPIEQVFIEPPIGL